MAENVERSFEHFLELPTKLRTKIIDEMEPDDRCRFIRCSKMCNKEAKASKNYIYEVRFQHNGSSSVEITAYYAGQLGFVLRIFSEGPRKKMRTYRCIASEQTLNEIELDSSTNIFLHGIEEFKHLLQSYQYSLRKLNIYIPLYGSGKHEVKNIDLGIDFWGNLEDLWICANINIPRNFSNLRSPLKRLTINDNTDEALASFEQIYKVQDNLLWWKANLNKHQFSQLTSKFVAMSLGKLTEKDVFSVIRAWQNGTLGKEIRNYQWFLRDSNFDKMKILKLLRKTDHQRGRIEIKHYKIPGTFATLLFYGNVVRFNVGAVDEGGRFLV